MVRKQKGTIPEEAQKLVAEFTIEKLVRPELGRLSFESAANELLATLWLIRPFREIDATWLSPDQQELVQDSLNSMNDVLRRLESFDSSLHDLTVTVKHRDRLISEFRANFKTWSEQLYEPLAYLRSPASPLGRTPMMWPFGRTFSAPACGINVWKNTDGSYSARGEYEGNAIEDAFIQNRKRCILLLRRHRETAKRLVEAWESDPAANAYPSVFKNLVCIDANGTCKWSADLPDYPDQFVAMKSLAGLIFASTFSGWRLTLWAATGKEIRRFRRFTK